MHATFRYAVFSALNELTEITATGDTTCFGSDGMLGGAMPAMDEIEILVDDLERDVDNRGDGKALSLFYGLSNSVWFFSELLQVTPLLIWTLTVPTVFVSLAL